MRPPPTNLLRGVPHQLPSCLGSESFLCLQGSTMLVPQDYLIAQGIGKLMPGQLPRTAVKYSFSQDGVRWIDLDALSEEMTGKAVKVTGMLSGEPAKTYTIQEPGAPPAAEGEVRLAMLFCNALYIRNKQLHAVLTGVQHRHVYWMLSAHLVQCLLKTAHRLLSRLAFACRRLLKVKAQLQAARSASFRDCAASSMQSAKIPVCFQRAASGWMPRASWW